jgi:hypothetical protein
VEPGERRDGKMERREEKEDGRREGGREGRARHWGE